MPHDDASLSTANPDLTDVEGRGVIELVKALAAALSGDGQIVVVGHGKGQSNEGDHLLALAGHALQPVQDTAIPRAG